MEEIIEKYKIRLSRAGILCLNDIVDNIIESANSAKYIENDKKT